MDLFPSPSSTPAAPEPWQCSGLGSAACGLAGRVLCAIATCVFAAVGSLVGAVTGSVTGMATESGMLRGAGIGAISGAVFSIEVLESSRDLWHSGDSGIWSILYMVDIVSSVLSGRLVREKVGLAVQSQISAISSPFAETSDLFDTTGGSKGLPADALRRLPEIEMSEDSAVDAAGEALCCSVCLQDFRVGEPARRLPSCGHVFHAPCIDCWLVRHGSCPLCRRDI
ncbi:NEP1-interacting protein 2-like isoform X2 [Phragmites australis]|uniref:NEP1-interacting protein 2-like isoform X2 n=1 Tax=Phragmites australis TaxID=29695 RepID=UPI002D77185B|nr:NEP1-interacting protein 2-like isoform X2 [Phragmites australis]